MSDRYRLGGLDDAQLLASLSSLVRSENESLADLLAHLAELDDRELCLALGYPSLFAYCTEALGFCKSSAGRRIAAARVCRRVPEAFARVANGELQLSVLCALRPHLSAGQRTVGTHVDVSHIAATPAGMTVTATVELIETDGRSLHFKVSCRDDAGPIGEGTHRRAIIDAERFTQRLAVKASGA